jgi:hypothetical protein
MRSLRRPQLLLALGLLTGLVAVILWLTGVFSTGPDLGGKLVDGPALGRCLGDVSAPDGSWKVKVGSSQEVAAGATTAEISFSSGPDLSVYPSEQAAEEVESRLSEYDDAGESRYSERWGNVVAVTGGRDPSDAALDAIYDCAERTATVPQGSGDGFEDCESDEETDLVVRGTSCADLPKLGRKVGDGVAEMFQYLCCDLSTVYVGDGEVEAIKNG